MPEPALIITPRRPWFDLKFAEIWRYRDLLFMLVKRDFVSLYKQTILGPLWFFIQPLLTTLMFTVVFGNIAGLSTEGIPKILFYLSGITCWTYFADTLTKTSETFSANANLFGKVYFPREIVPLSVVVSNLLKFGIQFLLFLAAWIWFLVRGEVGPPTLAILWFPFLLFLMAAIGLGTGLLISSMTTKYRDLRFLLAFGVQLAMYATPVIYGARSVPSEYRLFIDANPVTPIIETFRYGFSGQGNYSLGALAYSTACAALLLLLGLITFNRVEQTFMDTV